MHKKSGLEHLWVYLLLLPLLAACSQGGGTSAKLSVEPTSYAVPAGGEALAFKATVTGSTGTVSWTLSGSGSLSQTTGTSTLYTPPALSSSAATATVTASLSGTSLTAAAAVTVSPNAGNLTLTVSGLTEAGAQADVSVTGPNGFSKKLTASATLTDLVAGLYAVTANEVRVVSEGLEAVRRPSVQGSPVALAASQNAAVTVDYERVPGTGSLFVPNYFAGRVGAYTSSQLASSRNDAPDVLLDGTPSAQGLAFDKDGNLWVSDWDADKLRKYTPDQFISSGTPTPDVVISSNSNSLKNPTALAFDKEGGLWITNRGNATVVKYSADQLVSSGSPKPAVILSDDGSGNLSGPNGIAFDKNGGLWFSNGFSRSLYNFSDPSALKGAVTTSPDVIISSTITGTASLDAPAGLAFDKDGNLWVSNLGLNTLVEFTPDQLASSGTPVPAVTVSASGNSLSSPGGLAFDAGGNLWVSNSNGTVVKFGATTLTATGSPTPEVVLSSFSGIDLGFSAFNPPPSTLPLAQK